MALAAILGVLTVVSGMALMAASAYVISAAALHPSIADLQVAIVALRVFGLSRGLLRYAERLASHQATFRLLARLRLWFFASLEPLAPARLLSYRSGDLLARITSDIETLQEFFLRVLSPSMVAILVTLLLSAVLSGVSPALAILNLALACMGGVGLAWLVQRRTWTTANRLIRARSRLNASVVEALEGAAEWLVYGWEHTWAGQFRAQGQAMAMAQEERNRSLALVAAVSSSLGALATAATIALLTPHVRQWSLDGVFLASIALAVLASYETAGALPAAAEQAGTSRLAASRLIEIVDGLPEVDEGLGASLASPFRSLRLAGLRFHYPGDRREVLSGLSLDLAPGSRVAVLGTSGAGKSTLAHLLLRFWQVEPGQIQVNGHDVRDLRPEAVRAVFSSLLQPPFLFARTIRENITLGDDTLTTAQVEQALDQAGLTQRLGSSPEGIDAWVGEFGAMLSAGERQRVALARALARPAPILLLDEPTAALDPLTAGQVMENLWAALGERALLLMTHDPTGLERMDEILILDKGRLVARGNHISLAHADNLYRRMLAARRQDVILQRLQRRPEPQSAAD